MKASKLVFAAAMLMANCITSGATSADEIISSDQHTDRKLSPPLLFSAPGSGSLSPYPYLSRPSPARPPELSEQQQCVSTANSNYHRCASVARGEWLGTLPLFCGELSSSAVSPFGTALIPNVQIGGDLSLGQLSCYSLYESELKAKTGECVAVKAVEVSRCHLL